MMGEHILTKSVYLGIEFVHLIVFVADESFKRFSR